MYYSVYGKRLVTCISTRSGGCVAFLALPPLRGRDATTTRDDSVGRGVGALEQANDERLNGAKWKMTICAVQ